MKKMYILKSIKQYVLLIILAAFGSISNAQEGSCLNFDGINDYVYVSGTNSLNSLPLTIEAYVKPEFRNEFGNFPNNIISNDVPGSFGLGMGINIDAFGSHVIIEYKNGFISFDDPSIIAGNWVHIAVVYTTTNIKTYINGVLKNDFDYSFSGFNFNNYFMIGVHNDDDISYGTRRFFKGSIDEVRIWNRILSQEEIQYRMNCEFTGTSAAIVANYHFNQGIADADNSTVTTLQDSSGLNGNGTLIDFTLNGSSSNWVGNSVISNGTFCSTTTPAIQPNQCFSTLGTLNQPVYANLVANAQAYRFRVTDLVTNQVQTIDRVLRVFNFTQLVSYRYNRTYKVEVSAKVNNIFQAYGSSCFITTPAPTTKIQDSQCDITVNPTVNTTLYANNVLFANGYRFRVTDIDTSAEFIINRPIRDIRTSDISNFNFGKTYTIEVAIKYQDGTYSSYGSACYLFTEQLPTTSVPPPFVNFSTTNSTNFIYATPVLLATAYKFIVYSVIGGYYEITRTTPSLDLNTLPIEFRNVELYIFVLVVRGSMTGNYGDYYLTGLYTPTPGLSKVADIVSFVAAPNPFTDTFKILVNSNSKDAVEIKVFDMFGKIIETKTTIEKEIEIGNNYPSGVYNVVVSQDENTKTLRVIKR